MNKRIYDIFDNIYAENELKNKTEKILYNRISVSKVNNEKKLKLALATIILFIITGAFSYNFYFTPYSYIDIDINPSVELTINRFNHVIKIASYNDDGWDIISKLDINNKTYVKAIEELINSMVEQGYLKQDELLSLTVQTNDIIDEEDILQELITTVNSALEAHHTSMTADIFSVSEDIKHYAHDNNISPAKYLAIVELQQVNPEINFESCTKHSISEIKQLTIEHCKEHNRHKGCHH